MTIALAPPMQNGKVVDDDTITKLITGEEFFRMADTNWCELIEGKIVRYHPTGYAHGEYEANFVLALRTFTRQNKLGRVMTGAVGIYYTAQP